MHRLPGTVAVGHYAYGQIRGALGVVVLITFLVVAALMVAVPMVKQRRRRGKSKDGS